MFSLGCLLKEDRFPHTPPLHTHTLKKEESKKKRWKFSITYHTILWLCVDTCFIRNFSHQFLEIPPLNGILGRHLTAWKSYSEKESCRRASARLHFQAFSIFYYSLIKRGLKLSTLVHRSNHLQLCIVSHFKQWYKLARAEPEKRSPLFPHGDWLKDFTNLVALVLTEWGMGELGWAEGTLQEKQPTLLMCEKINTVKQGDSLCMKWITPSQLERLLLLPGNVMRILKTVW